MTTIFKHTNQLIGQTSPYLLQHAHNPVAWYPWGEEAIALAKKEQKPILVSIGYSACHWCHVMEKESFEDEATAAIMNEHFISIKIDREERPDLDAIYMDAVQAITGSGGWPLNVFLTPGLKPFYGGTYFPPVDAFNRKSWKNILLAVAAAWAEKPDEINIQAENITEHLVQLNNQLHQTGDTSSVHLDNTICNEIFLNLMRTADTKWGGFGKAPKFPQFLSIRYLLQHYYFYKNKIALQQALLSVDKILQGGIYDHVGSGIARYSTDNEWHVPHFEKMLYDNALFLAVLCEVFQITRNPKYEKAIHNIIQFVERELMNEEGGFLAAIDADSEGEEGKYYVWQKSEIEKILGTDADLFCEYFDISETDNWEHKNVLRILKSAKDFAAEKNLLIDDFQNTIETNLQKLFVYRKERTRPSTDDKIILSWNALMLHAVCKAAIVLDDDVFKNLAVKNYRCIIRHFLRADSQGGCYHTYKNGVAKFDAFLDDYVYLVQACLSLYELDFDEKYLLDAKKHLEFIIVHFSDEDGLYFYSTQIGSTDLIIRKKEMYDGATPSANGMMAQLLQKISVIFENNSWRDRSTKMVQNFTSLITKHPGTFSSWAIFLQQLVNGFEEIAVLGPDSMSMAKKIFQHYLPAKILICSNENSGSIPYLKNKKTGSGTQFFLCKKETCLPPFDSVDAFLNAI